MSTPESLPEDGPKPDQYRLWMCYWGTDDGPNRARFSLVSWNSDRQQLELEKQTHEAIRGDCDPLRGIGYIVGPTVHDCSITHDRSTCFMCMEHQQIPFF